MSTATRLPPSMTVAEFEAWQPPEGLHDRRWQLIDGEPVCMAPPGDDHGSIRSMVCYLVMRHLIDAGPLCRVVTTPGVIPRADAAHNERVPDLGITCTPAMGSRTIPEPVVLIEVLSPGSRAATRRNIPRMTQGLLVQSGGRTLPRKDCAQPVGLSPPGFDQRLLETLVPEGAYVPP